MYKKVVSLFGLVILISGCAVKKTEEPSLEGFDKSKLNRAIELYACSSYFNIVSTQQKKREDIIQYEKLAGQAETLGDELVAVADNDPHFLDYNVEQSLFKKGSLQAIEMIKAIGRDKTGTKYKDTTIACSKLIDKEQFIYNVKFIDKHQKNK